MGTRKAIKPKKPSASRLRRAAQEMDDAFSVFRGKQFAFAKLIYDAGNRDESSFRVALKGAANEWHSQGGWIGFNNSSIDEILRLLNEAARKSTQS
jgi:hypothetical protein